HLLKQIPYKDLTCDQKVTLPKRGKLGKYKAASYPFRMIEERF
ncbi:polyphosphate kinase 2, partial [Klebsiella pneumoniae]|nr:polyphosphate kinase 2 [Klebsiella pneumoniae]